MTRCEFCEGALTPNEPANVALLSHLGREESCKEQYDFLLQNLRSSWTASMSGG